MKTVPLFIISMLATATFGLADGIPVDHETGKLTCAHAVVPLTAEQIEETQALGTFTLTSEQWRQLRVKRPGCPKRFNTILPVTFNDCCCGVDGEYVIALSRNRIAVLTGDDHAVSLEAVRYELFKEPMVRLRSNERGEFYAGGILVPFPMLLKALAAPVDGARRGANGKITSFRTSNGQVREGRLYLTVELPMGAKPTDAVYHTRLGEIASTAERNGISHSLFYRDRAE